MFSQRDVLNIAFRQWKGESLKAIAPDYNTTEKALTELREENKADFKVFEAEFYKAEIQRVTLEDPIRKAQYGFVLSAYMLVRTRRQLPKAIVDFSQESDKTEAHLQTLAEAESILESFEADFGITLI